MDEKRKPFATITFRKPRISLLLSALLITAIAAVAVGSVLQERAERTAELESLEISLQDAQSSLRQTEADLDANEDRLRAAESRLADYYKHFAEPAGYYDYSEGKGKWLRLFSCSRVVLDSFTPDGDGDGATLVSYNVIDRKATADLTRRDNYDLVGEFNWTPPGEMSKIIYFYLRQDVLGDAAFTWPGSDDWAIVHRNWEDYLDEHCHQQ